jgi:hypothetical protein
LAVHFYRPDFTEAQAKSMITDMVRDLAGLDIRDLERGIAVYRQTPFPLGKFKPFPDSGTLIRLANVERNHRVEIEGKQAVKPQFGESRPIMWWMQPPYLWRSHWREADIPESQRAGFREYLAIKRKAGAEGWGENDFYGLERKYADRQAGKSV